MAIAILGVDLGKTSCSMDRSSYEACERARGEALARPVHRLALQAGRSIHVQIAFAELFDLPDDYLAKHAAAYLDETGPAYWQDAHGIGSGSHCRAGSTGFRTASCLSASRKRTFMKFAIAGTWPPSSAQGKSRCFCMTG